VKNKAMDGETSVAFKAAHHSIGPTPNHPVKEGAIRDGGIPMSAMSHQSIEAVGGRW
jgi:hypothetical protein